MSVVVPPGSGRCPSWTTESCQFDHCNNCRAYCDCKSGSTNIDIYYCPNYDYICENQNPTQCKKENNPTNTPGPTATETPSPSPTEIILVANNNTPTSSPITNTPIQEIVQAGDRRSFLILSIPISLIILSLFL